MHNPYRAQTRFINKSYAYITRVSNNAVPGIEVDFASNSKGLPQLPSKILTMVIGVDGHHVTNS